MQAIESLMNILMQLHYRLHIYMHLQESVEYFTYYVSLCYCNPEKKKYQILII